MLSRISVRHFCGVTLAALILAIPAAAKAQTGYTIIELPTLDGVSNGGAAINASGQVTGTCQVPHVTYATYHVVRWTGSTLEDLVTLCGRSGAGLAINDSGQITGSASTTDNASSHAARWTGTNVEDLGAPGGVSSLGRGINNSGQVAGDIQFADNSIHAVRWTGTNAEDLGTLGGAASAGYAINDSGQVTGDARLANENDTHAVIWTGTTIKDLGTLGGGASRGYSINASGQVTGQSTLPGNKITHAFRYDSTGMHDLGALNGHDTRGFSINSFGDIVGTAATATSASVPFLTCGDRLIDLNTFLPADSDWQLIDASGINDSGWITGHGNRNGQNLPYILKPVASTGVSQIVLDGLSDLTMINPAVPLGTFQFSLRAPGTTTELFRKTITLTPTAGNALGTYTLTGIPNGTYDIAIKGSKSLRVLLTNVTIDGTTALPDVALPMGDANGDNRVNIADFGLLMNRYGSAVDDGSGLYDPNCDFNYDGLIDLGDFGLLVAAYGSVGAP